MLSGHPGRRRRLLRVAGAVAGAIVGGLGLPARARPAPDEAAAFATRSFPEAIDALGGTPKASTKITLDVPQVADNGAFVPVTVSSEVRDTREILILVEGNPQPLAVRFTIPEGTEPFVATRIRMAQTGTVYAAVRTDTELFATARGVQVIVGGCD